MKPELRDAPEGALHPEEMAWALSNPRHGEKRGYRKITTTVPQWAYGMLVQESARRKIAGEPNQLLAALLREAITEYLGKLNGRS